VKGTVTYTERTETDQGPRPGKEWRALGPLAFFAGLTWKVIAYLMAFLTGLILILLAPWRMAGAATSIRTDTGPVAGYGAIALFVTPIAALVVCLTVIGLPLGIITLLLWGILLYLSQIPVSLFIGHAILGRNKPLESKGYMIGCLALGLLLLTLARAIPFVGFLVSLASGLFGLGAFVVTERRLRRSQGSAKTSRCRRVSLHNGVSPAEPSVSRRRVPLVVCGVREVTARQMATSKGAFE